MLLTMTLGVDPLVVGVAVTCWTMTSGSIVLGALQRESTYILLEKSFDSWRVSLS